MRTLAALPLFLAGCGDNAHHDPDGGSRDAIAGAECLPAANCTTDCWCVDPQVGTAALLLGVWGSSPTSVWAVGENGTILHWDGAAWSLQRSGTSAMLSGIHGTGDSDVWAVGGAFDATGVNATTLHWNGSSWSNVPISARVHLQRVWAIAPDDVWAVGDLAGDGSVPNFQQMVQHWDGTQWTVAPGNPNGESVPMFHGVWASSANDVYVAGGFRSLTGFTFVTRWDGTKWTGSRSVDSDIVFGIHGTGPNDIWAGSSGGYPHGFDSWVLHFTGAVASPDAQLLRNHQLSQLWVADSMHIFFVGQYGHIVRGDGTTWTALASGTDTNLWGVWASAANDVWAVGEDGLVLHRAPQRR